MLHTLITIVASLSLLALSLHLGWRLAQASGLLPRRAQALWRSARMSLPRRAELGASRWCSHPLLQIALLALGIRLAVYLLGWAFHMSAMGTSGQYVGFWPSLDDIWAKWDAPHYLSLAEIGYAAPQNPLHIVFYPLYPWLVRLGALLTGDFFAAATLVSILCFTVACLVLYRWVEDETQDAELAQRSVLYLALFPFSFFYGAPYTESLFLLLTVSCIWRLRRGDWYSVAVLGGLAALTRNQGILLLVPIAIEAWRQRQQIALWQRLLALVGTASGFASYLWLNQHIFGNAWQFRIAQKTNWQQDFGFFAQNIANIWQGMLTDTHNMVFGIWLPTLICFAGALALLAWGRRRLPACIQAYALVYTVISFSPTWLLSGPRYMSVLFPLAVLLAMWATPARRRWLEPALAGLLSLAIYLFIRGWVY
ncbi:mannosyltransferase family protein [Chitinibacter tainanensis]|uniref:mannosyltransferase family protein n=1 Tax=Chitinibacter tainanensis TaxID=230667 RepID=UPI00235296F1|nr:mannosyltransferase family protein [Chitinibacter tainanensis]